MSGNEDQRARRINRYCFFMLLGSANVGNPVFLLIQKSTPLYGNCFAPSVPRVNLITANILFGGYKMMAFGNYTVQTMSFPDRVILTPKRVRC